VVGPCNHGRLTRVRGLVRLLFALRGSVVESRRETFGEPARIDEHDGGSMRRDDVQDAVGNRRPHR